MGGDGEDWCFVSRISVCICCFWEDVCFVGFGCFFGRKVVGVRSLGSIAAGLLLLRFLLVEIMFCNMALSILFTFVLIWHKSVGSHIFNFISVYLRKPIL